VYIHVHKHQQKPSMWALIRTTNIITAGLQ